MALGTNFVAYSVQGSCNKMARVQFSDGLCAKGLEPPTHRHCTTAPGLQNKLNCFNK